MGGPRRNAINATLRQPGATVVSRVEDLAGLAVALDEKQRFLRLLRLQSNSIKKLEQTALQIFTTSQDLPMYPLLTQQSQTLNISRSFHTLCLVVGA